MKENRNLHVKNGKNDTTKKNESEILLQLPLQIYGNQGTKVHMRTNNNNNNTTISKDDSQKSLFRLSSTFVECYCRIELKVVWYVLKGSEE